MGHARVSCHFGCWVPVPGTFVAKRVVVESEELAVSQVEGRGERVLIPGVNSSLGSGHCGIAIDST